MSRDLTTQRRRRGSQQALIVRFSLRRGLLQSVGGNDCCIPFPCPVLAVRGGRCSRFGIRGCRDILGQDLGFYICRARIVSSGGSMIILRL